MFLTYGTLHTCDVPTIDKSIQKIFSDWWTMASTLKIERYHSHSRRAFPFFSVASAATGIKKRWNSYERDPIGQVKKATIFSPLGESEGVDAFECMMHSLSAIRSDDEFTPSTLLIFKVASLGIGVLLAVFGCISPIQSKRRVSSSISSVAL